MAAALDVADALLAIQIMAGRRTLTSEQILLGDEASIDDHISPDSISGS